eukprot:645505-Prymnesium_polylepis.1
MRRVADGKEPQERVLVHGVQLRCEEIQVHDRRVHSEDAHRPPRLPPVLQLSGPKVFAEPHQRESAIKLARLQLWPASLLWPAVDAARRVRAPYDDLRCTPGYVGPGAAVASDQSNADRLLIVQAPILRPFRPPRELLCPREALHPADHR